jgi:hypothetical protein
VELDGWVGLVGFEAVKNEQRWLDLLGLTEQLKWVDLWGAGDGSVLVGRRRWGTDGGESAFLPSSLEMCKAGWDGGCSDRSIGGFVSIPLFLRQD